MHPILLLGLDSCVQSSLQVETSALTGGSHVRAVEEDGPGQLRIDA